MLIEPFGGKQHDIGKWQYIKSRKCPKSESKQFPHGSVFAFQGMEQVYKGELERRKNCDPGVWKDF